MPLPRITINSGNKITTSIVTKEKRSPEKKKESVEKRSPEKKDQLLKFPKRLIKNNGVYIIGVDKDGYLKESATSVTRFKSIKQYDYDLNDSNNIVVTDDNDEKKKRLEYLSSLNLLTEEEKTEYENLNFEINGVIKRKTKSKN